MDRRRELHAQRAEERRLLKEEQRVRGVNLEATALGEEGIGQRNFMRKKALQRMHLNGNLERIL